MNAMMLTMLLAIAVYAICIWVSPVGLRWLSAQLLARADVVDEINAAKKVKPERLAYWQGELGVDRKAAEEVVDA